MYKQKISLYLCILALYPAAEQLSLYITYTSVFSMANFVPSGVQDQIGKSLY